MIKLFFTRKAYVDFQKLLICNLFLITFFEEMGFLACKIALYFHHFPLLSYLNFDMIVLDDLLTMKSLCFDLE